MRILLRVRRSDISIVLVAAFVFADATIVTLALPNLLVDLDTTVYGVAAVLGVYTATLGGTALLLTRVDFVILDSCGVGSYVELPDFGAGCAWLPANSSSGYST